MINALIFGGHGDVGSVLKQKLDRRSDWKVTRVIQRHHVYDGKRRLLGEYNPHDLKTLDPYIPPNTQIAFLCIPAQKEGNVAHAIILHLVARMIRAVTCEKDLMAYKYEKLLPILRFIGFSASAGGGTQFLHTLKRRIYGYSDAIAHVIPNGTLNFTFDAMARRGLTLGESLEDAGRLGYTDPGATDHLGVINNELCKDSPKKTVITHNYCIGPKKFLTPDRIDVRRLTQAGLKHLEREAKKRRFIVSFYPPGKRADVDHDVIGGFSYRHEGWTVCAGFKRIDSDPIFEGRLPRGVDNGFITYEGDDGEDGVYVYHGPGAGANPTTRTMITNAMELLANAK